MTSNAARRCGGVFGAREMAASSPGDDARLVATKAGVGIEAVDEQVLNALSHTPSHPFKLFVDVFFFVIVEEVSVVIVVVVRARRWVFELIRRSGSCGTSW